MSLKKGNSSSSQTSSATGSATTNAINPDWVTSGVQGLLGQTMDLGNTDPQSYVAGASPLQTQAFTQGANQTSGADRYAGANQAASSIGEGGEVIPASLLDNLGSYMSPYTQNVVDTTLNDFDVNAGRTLAQQAADGARGSQAFGGSRWGVQLGETAGELSRARASADAGLRDSAFNTGAGLSNQDAARRQEAAMFNSSQDQAGDISRAGLLSGNAGGAQTADAQNLGLLSGLGDTQRGIAGEQAQAPLQLLLAQAGLLGNLPLDLFKGETSDSTTSSSGTSKGKTSGVGASIGWNAKNGFSLGG